MSKIEELINQLCPDGVDYKTLGFTCEIKTGKGITKNDGSDTALYPIISGGKEPMGYYHNFNRLENTVTISRVGANAGYVSFITVKFYLNDKCFSIIPIEEYKNQINTNFLFYFLKENENSITGLQSEGGVPTINTTKISNLTIPIPPLPIQQEIVNILDKFTQLEAELEAELEARKKQYEYYRNQLLNFEGKSCLSADREVEWKTLGEVCENIVSGKNKNRIENGQYPVYGSTGIIGYTDAFSFNDDCLLVARVGANAGFVHKAKGKYDVSDNTLIVKPKSGYNLSFAYFQLQNLELNKIAVGGGQPLITASQLKKYSIPIPPFAEQKRIAGILDKFDSLVNDISVGLPAEIEARRKQYEYYRGKLLSFKMKSHDQARIN